MCRAAVLVNEAELSLDQHGFDFGVGQMLGEDVMLQVEGIMNVRRQNPSCLVSIGHSNFRRAKINAMSSCITSSAKEIWPWLHVVRVGSANLSLGNFKRFTTAQQRNAQSHSLIFVPLYHTCCTTGCQAGAMPIEDYTCRCPFTSPPVSISCQNL